MSPLLKAFLQDWLAWVDEGAPDEEPFTRMWGLCSNLHHWAIKRRASCGELDRELKIAFAGDGLNEDYPFGYAAYESDQEDETMHVCEARLAWVRSKIARKQEA